MRSAAVLALAVAVVGCGSSDDDAASNTEVSISVDSAPDTTPDETTPGSTPETTPETTTDTAPAITEAPDTSADVATTVASELPADTTPTAPGTQLVFGDTAVVALDSDQSDQLVALTISALRPGTAEELAELQVPDLPAGATSWYVDLTVTNISAPETGVDYLPSTSFQFAALSGVEPLVPIIKFTAFEPCENELVDDLAVGASTTTCQVFLSEAGLAADQVLFTPDFDTAPILWSAG